MEKQHLKLAFSGGGFRATFYCLGAYRRLVELGIDSSVTHISSVSGGSIAAGVIMTALANGKFQGVGDFDARVTEPLRRLGQINLRGKMLRNALIPGLTNLGILIRRELPFTRLSRLFPERLDKEIFHGTRMVDLPTAPEWSCNATCLNTMKRFRFKNSDIYGNLLGYSTDIHDITVAFAVAASAAFPLMFAPLQFDNRNRSYTDKYNSSSYSSPPEKLYLTDGGVYDNLGSENILKEQSSFIVVDASASSNPWDERHKPSYKNMTGRILNTSLEQNVLLRRRLLYKNGSGIQLLINRSVKELMKSEEKNRISERPLPEYPSDYEAVEKLIGSLRTDLDAFHDVEIDALMWSGSIKMDLAIKSLHPELVALDYWDQIPVFPDYPLEQVQQILEVGSQRKYIGRLHKSLNLDNSVMVSLNT